MFGSLRFLLAVLVALAHVGTGVIAGVFAVVGFYIISGYLMCMVLNRRYGFDLSGLRAYFANRFLRIYPPYWFACLLTAGVIAALGEPAVWEFQERWRLPSGLAEWADNLLIVTLTPTGTETRLIPPAWALRVEIFYYVAIGAGLGRGPKIALAWCLLSVAYHVYLEFIGANWQARYFPIPAASLPFSIGAVIYHRREIIPESWRSSANLLFGLFLLWLANLVLAPYYSLGTALGPSRLYLNIVLMAALVALLAGWRARSNSWRLRDSRIGDLSYPIYLIHLPVGLAVESAGFPPAGPSTMLFLAALGPILLCAWIMLRLVDDPVERLRDRVKRAFEARRTSR